jgi:molybdopterin-guanine dinucleotide biosynthesis protein A
VQIGLSNGIGQIELSCVGPNQNHTPTLGLKKFDPEKGGKQGELAGTCTCLNYIPKGWLVVAANVGSHDPVRVL